MLFRTKRARTSVFGSLAALMMVGSALFISGASATSPSAHRLQAHSSIVTPQADTNPITAPEKKTNQTLTADTVLPSWNSMDPDQSSATVSNLWFWSAMFQSFFTFDATGKHLVPVLATSYTLSANHEVYTINLKKKVKFQDGTAWDAQAAVFNIDREASASQGSNCTSYYTNFVSAVATSTYQVQITFSQPYTALMNDLSGLLCGYQVSPTAVRNEGASGFANNPVGTGPYKFVSQINSQQLVFSRWAGYWGKRAASAQVIINGVGTDEACLAAVETGTAQVCFNTGISAYQLAAGHRSVKWLDFPSVSVENMRINMTAAPFNSFYARQALAHAINTPLLMKQLYNNSYTPTEGYLTSSSFAYTGSRVPGAAAFNEAAAKADVAKVPGGMTFNLLTFNNPDSIQLAEAIQTELNAAGMNVQVTPLTTSAETTDFRNKTYQVGLTNSYTFPDPDAMYFRNFYSKSANNQVGLNDPVFDRLVTEGRETASQAQRRVLYKQAEIRLADKDIPMVPLFDQSVNIFVSKKLVDFENVGAGMTAWWTAYMS